MEEMYFSGKLENILLLVNKKFSFDKKLKGDFNLENIPDTESLKDTYERVIKFYSKEIENKISENILISAHGNSIRALCKHLFNLDDNEISKLEIPTGNPLLIELEKGKISNCKYLDQDRAKDLLVF